MDSSKAADYLEWSLSIMFTVFWLGPFVSSLFFLDSFWWSVLYIIPVLNWLWLFRWTYFLVDAPYELTPQEVTFTEVTLAVALFAVGLALFVKVWKNHEEARDEVRKQVEREKDAAGGWQEKEIERREAAELRQQQHIERTAREGQLLSTFWQEIVRSNEALPSGLRLFAGKILVTCQHWASEHESYDSGNFEWRPRTEMDCLMDTTSSGRGKGLVFVPPRDEKHSGRIEEVSYDREERVARYFSDSRYRLSISSDGDVLTARTGNETQELRDGDADVIVRCLCEGSISVSKLKYYSTSG